MHGNKGPKPKTLEEALKKIEELYACLKKHPAAKANRIVHLVLFALGGLTLVAAGMGLNFHNHGNTSIQILVGILLVAPETIGVAGATEAAKSFASSMGTALGRTIAKRD